MAVLGKYRVTLNTKLVAGILPVKDSTLNCCTEYVPCINAVNGESHMVPVCYDPFFGRTIDHQ